MKITVHILFLSVALAKKRCGLILSTSGVSIQQWLVSSESMHVVRV